MNSVSNTIFTNTTPLSYCTYFDISGNYCEKGTVNPVECPLGTYMPYGANGSGVVTGTPAGRASDCLKCPGGSLCENGAVSTSGCGLGLYSKPGNSECTTCLAG